MQVQAGSAWLGPGAERVPQGVVLDPQPDWRRGRSGIGQGPGEERDPQGVALDQAGPAWLDYSEIPR